MKIAIAQKNFSVGAVQDNALKIIASATAAAQQNADLCVFPELALSGYPPEDLLFQPNFQQAITQELQHIITASAAFPQLTIILGFPHYHENKIYNAMAVIRAGQWETTYHKRALPNYGVFDEKRYFTPGTDNAIITLNNLRIGLLICEDIWQPEPLACLMQEPIDLVVVINASPFSVNKFQQRLELLSAHAKNMHCPYLYMNVIAGQDDLIFDGGACWVNAEGALAWRADFFQERLYYLNVQKENNAVQLIDPEFLLSMPSKDELMYQALVLGLRDYVEKNHIQGVVIGLSGGIDSALVLAIAVDALGSDRVMAITMPSRYNAEISIIDAKKQAEILQVKLHEISIEPLFSQFIQTLQPYFANLPPDVTEENLQSRCRGMLLMAFANKYQRIVIGTSNKSELAVGYGTLYGDILGAYCVLKDVLKTQVYRLAHYRNSLSHVIPTRVLERAPSAELAPNQADQDSLPPYEILDAIIERYEEYFQSIETIVAAGFESGMVLDIVKKIDSNEYKRRQGAPGPKVSDNAFIRERRFPITNEWKI